MEKEVMAKDYSEEIDAILLEHLPSDEYQYTDVPHNITKSIANLLHKQDITSRLDEGRMLTEIIQRYVKDKPAESFVPYEIQNASYNVNVGMAKLLVSARKDRITSLEQELKEASKQ